MKKRSGTLFTRNRWFHLRYKIEGCPLQIPLHTKSRAEAEKSRDEFMLHRQGGLDQYESFLKSELERIRKFRLEDPESVPLIADAWDLYLKSPHRPNTDNLEQIKGAWRQFTDGLPSKRARISDITPQDAHDRMEAIYNAGLAQATANTHLIYLKAILRSLLPETTPNPFDKAKARGGRLEKDLSYIPVTLPQITDLLRHTAHWKGSRTPEEAHRELYGAFLVMAYTGLRRGDAFGLLIEEVHFDRKVLIVRVNKTAKRKKGKSAYAKIGLHPVLAAELRGLIGNRTSGFVFQQIAKWSRNTVTFATNQVFKRARVERLVPYSRGMKNLYGTSSMRHLMEDRLREAGVHQTTINVILCHADRTMAATYSTVTDKEVYDAVVSAYPDVRPESKGTVMQLRRAS